jgi:hypothetical protein
MDEDDAVDLALLRIGGRYKETDIKTGSGKDRSGTGKPGNHAPGKRIESLR